MPLLDAVGVRELERVVREGGVAVFPADTVYGLACDPDSPEAVQRVRALKGRAPERPSAVLYGSLEAAEGVLAGLGERTCAAATRLLPGAVTLLLPNSAGLFGPACAPDPTTLGLRVPAFTGRLAPLAALRVPLAQTSANPSGAPDVHRLADVDPGIATRADLALDGGALPGTASTVVDLRRFEETGAHAIVREGAVPAADIAAKLS